MEMKELISELNKIEDKSRNVNINYAVYPQGIEVTAKYFISHDEYTGKR